MKKVLFTANLDSFFIKQDADEMKMRSAHFL